MRIVSGVYRGRTLAEFKGNDVRPTSDMVRESLFNILQFRIADKTFLDLFSGTGAVGIEALSRGAKHVTFNDFSRESVALTKKNLEKVGNPQNVTVTCRDGGEFYKYADQKYDIIFLDPPYKSDVCARALATVKDLLCDDGIAIFENEKPFCEKVEGLVKVDERKYGRAYITFFEKEK